MNIPPAPVVAPLDKSTYVTGDIWRQWFQQIVPVKGFWTPEILCYPGTCILKAAEGRYFLHGDMVTIVFSIGLQGVNALPHTGFSIGGLPPSLMSSIPLSFPIFGAYCSYTGQLWGVMRLAPIVLVQSINGGSISSPPADTFFTNQTVLTGTVTYSL